jgi:hypothetical protein
MCPVAATLHVAVTTITTMAVEETTGAAVAMVVVVG